MGAAREAACKDVPALAFSLDNHKARTEEQYRAAAIYATAIIKVVLAAASPPLSSLSGHVLNVNIPGSQEVSDIKGLFLCSQGHHCSFPDFREVEADPHFSSAKNGNHEELSVIAGSVKLRAFRNTAGYLRTDTRRGTDSWAVHEGWVAVTPVGLYSDIPLSADAASDKAHPDLVRFAKCVLVNAAHELRVPAKGIEELSNTAM